MKKLIALLLALVMVFALAACGGEKTPAETKAPAADAPKDDAPQAAPPIVKGTVAKRTGSAPSVLYTVLAAVSVLLLIGTAVLSAVNYLNIYEQQNISLPIVSK